MADYPNNKTFIKGKFHSKYEGKIACWIPADQVAIFMRLAQTERGDLNFVIAANTKQTKNSHYAYVSVKAPAIPEFPQAEKFEAPSSLETELASETEVIF
jgi:hypothetical protein